MTDTLQLIRVDSTAHARAKSTRSGDPRLADRLTTLDADPTADQVTAIVLGVADDRGVQLAGGRVGAVDGPQRLRDYLFAMPAPQGLAPGSVLHAGDLRSAGHTAETHARLAEVVAVLRERFPRARLAVIGGGHDHAYGEVLGLGRTVGRAHKGARLALLHVAALTRVRQVQGERAEPHAGTGIRRLLQEPATRLAGPSMVSWGLQRAHNPASHLQFLADQGVRCTWLDEVDGDDRRAGATLIQELQALAGTHEAVNLSIDLGAFAQSVSPGVSHPVPLGVPAGAVVRAAAALGTLTVPTQLGVYELNPRFDRDGASARLGAQIVWSYLTGLV